MMALGAGSLAIPLIPVVVGSIVAVGVLALTIYMLVNHNKPAPNAHVDPDIQPKPIYDPEPNRKPLFSRRRKPVETPLGRPLLELQRQNDTYSALRAEHEDRYMHDVDMLHEINQDLVH